MKINIFDKALEILLNKTHLNKPSVREDIYSAYFVHFNEAYSDITYFYVITEDNREALYLYPGYKFLAGENFLSKKELEKLPKKEYVDRKDLVRNEATEGLFYRLYGSYLTKRNSELSYNKYSNGFSYLTSLYYGENENYKKDYEDLYKAVKKECDNLEITYETDPETIIKDKLKKAYSKDDMKLLDFRICYSKEALDDYFNTHISNNQNPKTLSFEVRNLQYLKSDYIMSYPGEFLTKSENLILALTDKNYPNRESILKNYLEFFISKDLTFSIANYLDELVTKADNLKMNENLERLNNNVLFIEDLQKLIEHDPEKETYRYHATGSLYDAKRILEEGFYMFSNDLDSTSFQEFNVDQILTYSYGNGTQNFEDYIVVLSEPKDEDTDIVTRLTDEEIEKVTIVPRRNAIMGNKPTYKVDKKYIVGIIDKKQEKIIFNQEYINNVKKQINM